MELINGDCFEILKTVPDSSVDLILTDPPYGINYNSNRRVVADKFERFSLDDNLGWIDDFVAEAYRLLKDDSAIYVFCSWHNVDIFKQALQRRFKVKNLLVWNKNVHGLGDLKGSFSPKHELCFYAHKGRCLNRGKRTPDVLNFAKIPSKELKHPTEKPTALLDLMIKNSSDEGDLVLDPFMGSGTTGLACIGGGRRFMGVEIDKVYFDVAVERLQNGSGSVRQ